MGNDEYLTTARLGHTATTLYTHPAPTVAKAETVESIASRIVQDVAELPDRSSPDDQPEMMLVSSDELYGIVRECLAAAPAAGGES